MVFSLMFVIVFASVGCTKKQATLVGTKAVKPSVDAITAASGSLYYPAGL